MFIYYNGSKTIIFIHIPKTAGTTIRHVLRFNASSSGSKFLELTDTQNNVDVGHLPLYMLPTYFPDLQLDQCTILTCIRNPFDRVYSAYLFCQRHYPDVPMFKLPFLQFVKTTLRQIVEGQVKSFLQRQNLPYLGVHFAPAYIFLTDINGKVKHDFLVHQGNFKDEFSSVLNCLKLKDIGDIQENCSNNKVTKPYEYYHHYDAQSLDIIRHLYNQDFKIFGHASTL